MNPASTPALPAHTGHPRAVKFNRAVPIGTTVIVQEPGRQAVSARTINWATGKPDGRVVVDLDGFYRSTPIEYIRLPERARVEVPHAA
jgi:hypothetical protein